MSDGGVATKPRKAASNARKSSTRRQKPKQSNVFRVGGSARQSSFGESTSQSQNPNAAKTSTASAAPLQFITDGNIGGIGENAAARKAIRSHVMKNHFYQKKAPSTQNAASASQPAKPLKEFKGRWRLSGPTAKKSGVRKGADSEGAAHRRSGSASSGGEATGTKSTQPDEMDIVQSIEQEHQIPRSRPATDHITRNLLSTPEWDPVVRMLQAHNGEPIPGSIAIHPEDSYGGRSSTEDSELNVDEVLIRLAWGDLATQLSASSKLDPFNGLPIPGNRDVERLLWFHNANFSDTLTYDADFLNAVLTSVAYAISLTAPNTHEKVMQHHRSEALNALSTQLSSPHHNIHLPAKLVALIIVLAAFEVLLGAYDIASLHLQTLSSLFSPNKDGNAPSAVSQSDILSRAFHWLDFHVSTALRRTPLLSLQSTYKSAYIPHTLLERLASQYSYKIPSIPLDNDTLERILHNVRLLTRLSTPPAPPEPFDPAALTTLLYETEDILLGLPDRWSALGSLARTHGATPFSWISSADHAALSIAWATGLHLFLLSFFRSIPPEAKTVSIMEDRLRVVLERREMFMVFLWEGRLDCLLWCFWVVWVSARRAGRNERRRWAVFHGKIVRKILNLHDFGALEFCLGRVVSVPAWKGELEAYSEEIMQEDEDAAGDGEKAEEEAADESDGHKERRRRKIEESRWEGHDDERSEPDWTGIDPPIILWS